MVPKSDTGTASLEPINQENSRIRYFKTRSTVQQELHWHDEHRNVVWMSIELVAVVADYFKISKANYPKSKTLLNGSYLTNQPMVPKSDTGTASLEPINQENSRIRYFKTRSTVQQELHWHDEHRNVVWMSIELVAVVADYFKILKANYPKSKTLLNGSYLTNQSMLPKSDTGTASLEPINQENSRIRYFKTR